jgi:hypothetical protein
MRTQNRKFTTILVAGIIAGGAIALGYACGGDDTTGPGVNPPPVDAGTGGSANPGAGGSGTGGTAGGGTGGTAGGGTGGTAGGGTGGSCQASGSFDNSQIKSLLLADGGLPTF